MSPSTFDSVVERELLGICKQSMLQLGQQLRQYVDQLHHKDHQKDVTPVIIKAALELIPPAPSTTTTTTISPVSPPVTQPLHRNKRGRPPKQQPTKTSESVLTAVAPKSAVNYRPSSVDVASPDTSQVSVNSQQQHQQHEQQQQRQFSLLSTSSSPLSMVRDRRFGWSNLSMPTVEQRTPSQLSDHPSMVVVGSNESALANQVENAISVSLQLDDMCVVNEPSPTTSSGQLHPDLLGSTTSTSDQASPALRPDRREKIQALKRRAAKKPGPLRNYTHEAKSAFLNEVCQYPEIWWPYCGADQREVEQCWTDVAGKLNMGRVEELKDLWRALRSCYRSVKSRNRHNPFGRKNETWPYYKKMKKMDHDPFVDESEKNGDEDNDDEDVYDEDARSGVDSNAASLLAVKREPADMHDRESQESPSELSPSTSNQAPFTATKKRTDTRTEPDDSSSTSASTSKRLRNGS